MKELPTSPEGNDLREASFQRNSSLLNAVLGMAAAHLEHRELWLNLRLQA